MSFTLPLLIILARTPSCSIPMLLVSMGLFSFALPAFYHELVFEYYGEIAMVACCIGILISQLFYIRGGRERHVRCLTTDQVGEGKRFRPVLAPISASQSFLSEFFLGCEWNPRICGIDVKMVMIATYGLHT